MMVAWCVCLKLIVCPVSVFWTAGTGLFSPVLRSDVLVSSFDDSSALVTYCSRRKIFHTRKSLHLGCLVLVVS